MQTAADGDGLAGLVAGGSCLGVLATDQVMGGYGLLGDGRTTWRRVDYMLETFGCWSQLCKGTIHARQAGEKPELDHA